MIIFFHVRMTAITFLKVLLWNFVIFTIVSLSSYQMRISVSDCILIFDNFSKLFCLNWIYKMVCK